MYFTCLEKVSLGSSERPRILGNGSVVRILLLMDILRDLEYSAGSGMKRGGLGFICIDDEVVLGCPVCDGV